MRVSKMSDKIVKGYTQLDFKVVNSMPQYPSFVLTHWDGETTDTYKTTREHIIFYGTDLLSYLKSYDSVNYSLLENAIANNEDFEYKVYLPSFDETKQLYIYIWYRAYYYQYNISCAIYNSDGTGYYNIANLQAGVYNVTKGSPIYIAIPPDYTRTGTPRLYLFSFLNKKDDTCYILRGSSSDLTKVSTILNDNFHNKPPEKEEGNIIGETPFNGDNISTNIDHPELPGVGILNGLHNMYQPDLAVMKQINKSLWSKNFIDNIVKLYNNPLESIVSLTLSPLQPSISDNVTNVIVGNLPLTYTENNELQYVYCREITNQYGTYSFGDLSLFETYGSYIDYNTNIDIFIPYIGMQKLSVDDVMSKILNLSFNVDFFTGDFIATLKSRDISTGLNSVLYHWKGNILSHIPISSSNYSNMFLTGLNTIMSVGTGNISSIISNASGFKPDVTKGGNTSGNVGALDNFQAYIIITQPIESKPNNYKKLKGLTSNIDNKLSLGMGYIICDEIHIKNVNATEEEKKELEKLYKSGVIL